MIRKLKLRSAMGNSLGRVNNFRDHSNQFYSPDEIVERALARQDERIDYNLLTNNCEHFVTKCRYGVAISGQAVATARTAGYIFMGPAFHFFDR